MKVYLNDGSKRDHTLYVQPGNDIDNSEWRTKDGKGILMPVKFKGGMARVEENLGQYLIDKKYARNSRLILPEDAREAA